MITFKSVYAGDNIKTTKQTEHIQNNTRDTIPATTRDTLLTITNNYNLL